MTAMKNATWLLGCLLLVCLLLLSSAAWAQTSLPALLVRDDAGRAVAQARLTVRTAQGAVADTGSIRPTISIGSPTSLRACPRPFR